jgi:hypothetical protein
VSKRRIKQSLQDALDFREKRCPQCKDWLPLSNFPRSRTGHHALCLYHHKLARESIKCNEQGTVIGDW